MFSAFKLNLIHQPDEVSVECTINPVCSFLPSLLYKWDRQISKLIPEGLTSTVIAYVMRGVRHPRMNIITIV